MVAMATVMGGIGKQVLGELGDVVKKASKDTAKAGVDIVKGTVENVIGGGDDKKQDDVGKQSTFSGQVTGGQDPMQQMKQKKAAEKEQGLNRVRKQLEEYISKKRQKDSHEEAVGKRQEGTKKYEESQKQESEREVMINQARRQGGGTGEMARKKH